VGLPLLVLVFSDYPRSSYGTGSLSSTERLAGYPGIERCRHLREAGPLRRCVLSAVVLPPAISDS